MPGGGGCGIYAHVWQGLDLEGGWPGEEAPPFKGSPPPPGGYGEEGRDGS